MSRDYTNVVGYIYKITSPNNKIYIGQTVRLDKRKTHYKNLDFKQQTKLWNSYQKYQWNILETFEIVEECLCGENKSHLNEREIYWINHYDSFISGLNCNEGGLGNLGYTHSKETLLKMSKAKLGVKHTEERNLAKSVYTEGRQHTEEAKRKMSEVKKAKMTDELKAKIRDAQKGITKPSSIGNKGGSRKIKCTTNGVIYKSIKEAHESLGISCSSIIHILKKRKQYVNGLSFEYVQEE